MCVGDSQLVTDGLRVAFTLEQCWHAVPGGTARSALESARAPTLDRRRSRRRRGAPRSTAGSGVDPDRTRASSAAARAALYESWHYARRPKVQRATGPVDVVHVTGGAVAPHSAPMIVTVHDLAFLHEPTHFTRHGLRFFKRALDLTRRDADLVLVPSEATADDCIAHGFEPERVRVVPWGIDIEVATESDIETSRARYWHRGRYVLWTGTIEPRKNLSTLLRAFASVDGDTELVLVGPAGGTRISTRCWLRCGHAYE